MSTPRLINLPPPPPDPVTPSEMGPGTPNSATTSLSALSTTAIKDGYQGHALPHSYHQHGSRDPTAASATLDAERADRISRLAGLERVSTTRSSQPYQPNPNSGPNPPPGYFDNTAPQIRERSTVGSASATGSAGGRTTWASGSVDYDADKMSEDQDDGVSSTGGFSDENASLVGFGEGAGSTVSAPISTATSRAKMARLYPGNPSASKVTSPAFSQQHGTPMSGMVSPSSVNDTGSTDPRMMDGVSYDANTVDPKIQSPQTRGFTGQGVAELPMRDDPGRSSGGMAETTDDRQGS